MIPDQAIPVTCHLFNGLPVVSVFLFYRNSIVVHPLHFSFYPIESSTDPFFFVTGRPASTKGLVKTMQHLSFSILSPRLFTSLIPSTVIYSSFVYNLSCTRNQRQATARSNIVQKNTLVITREVMELLGCSIAQIQGDK